eukprot:365463-Chlamydomonas_euryale.AAC.6
MKASWQFSSGVGRTCSVFGSHRTSRHCARYLLAESSLSAQAPTHCCCEIGACGRAGVMASHRSQAGVPPNAYIRAVSLNGGCHEAWQRPMHG